MTMWKCLLELQVLLDAENGIQDIAKKVQKNFHCIIENGEAQSIAAKKFFDISDMGCYQLVIFWLCFCHSFIQFNINRRAQILQMSCWLYHNLT